MVVYKKSCKTNHTLREEDIEVASIAETILRCVLTGRDSEADLIALT